MSETFDAFFRTATATAARPSGNEPYDYQCRLACGKKGDRPEAEWLAGGTACESRLISIPTGLGKTAAVVLAWMWNRVVRGDEAWPRRLVYCLPMRTLVEQTCDEAEKWIENLLHAADVGTLTLLPAAIEQLRWLRTHSPIILMGGEENDDARRDWDIHPERPAILIGTQDMLLSRALNRGYGMSRYRWPMHFALLNHDALWVLDETQLIGVGIETSAQLDAFRRFFAEGCSSQTQSPRAFTWWMSATLADVRLGTVDQPRPLSLARIALDVADHRLKSVEQRFTAPKPIVRTESLRLNSVSDKDAATYAKQVALLVNKQHHAGTFTLVVLNNVGRAQAVYQALRELDVPDERLALVHSRFRPGDRATHERRLFSSGERIVVATQAVEAGVDVSARLLVTELAPWSSLVQRFGRCNRAGIIDDAEIIWIDLADDEQVARPYATAECAAARVILEAGVRDVSPRSISAITAPVEPRVIRPVLRRKDLLDLFDTTPDIAGNDLDVSRYIRDGDDNDVQVFWRDLGGIAPAPDTPASIRQELCSVSIARFGAFFDKLTKRKELGIYIWNPLEERWSAARAARPGGVYLLDTRAGGYSSELGWTGELAEAGQTVAAVVFPNGPAPEANVTDRGANARTWLTLTEHTQHVTDTVQTIAAALNLAPAASAMLTTTARWHDVGKAHAVFQDALKTAPGIPAPEASTVYAKAPNRARRYAVPGFRHELASALAVLLAAPVDLPERDLVAYLVAAHHGKVRLSIRALPGEAPPREKPEARCARGIVDGDTISSDAFAALGLRSADLLLDLSFMELGEGPHGPSWLTRTLHLRERLGPFQLAYLEALLRAADMRASAAEAQ